MSEKKFDPMKPRPLFEVHLEVEEGEPVIVNMNCGDGPEFYKVQRWLQQNEKVLAYKYAGKG